MDGAGLAGLIPTVLSYAVCSSTLLVANKYALELFPKTNTLLLFQFLVSFMTVGLAVAAGLTTSDKLEWNKVRHFIPVVIIFYAVLWSNMKALDALGVDVVILFRSLTPFAISLGDYIYLGRAMPSAQSWFSLVSMMVCTICIFVREPHIRSEGLLWGVLYYVILSIDMLYLKKVTVDVKLSTNGRVVYTNLLSAVPALALAIGLGEFGDFQTSILQMSLHTALAVGATCVLGFGMSYLSWLLRAKVSALTFVVIGILCKIGSVVINALFLSKHLTLQSMILVALGITASTLYEQPKARVGQKDVNKEETDKVGEKEDAKVLLEGGESDEDKVQKPRISSQKLSLMIGISIGIVVTFLWDRVFQLE
uniref:Sugar phosphate transporter domain-containing protein n=1 Tax=Compsopogon caeruleus TaxID=31354 RepID=A0A6T6CTK4_9RHOD|mmetsp:Transcript_7924/g.15918  ORF Transcript_7924/g.15918 Transcript_7924/m.15918 type:complete len:366 (+) Transcript_7924:128-1225(+)